MNTYIISDVLQVEEMTKKLVPGKLQIDGNFNVADVGNRPTTFPTIHPCILHWRVIF